MEQELIEWQAWEHNEGEPRTLRWFAWIGGGALALIIIALLAQNFLLAIILLVGTAAVLAHHARAPELIDFALSPKGVRIGNRLYPYRELKAFSLSEPEERSELRLHSDKILLPHITIPLEDQVDPSVVRGYLLAYLPEERHDENLIENLIRFLDL